MARRFLKLCEIAFAAPQSPGQNRNPRIFGMRLSMATPVLGKAALCFVLVLAALLPQGARAAGEDVAAYKRAVEASFAQWLEALWPNAQAAGISRETFGANLKDLKLNWSLPHLGLPDSARPVGPALPSA